MSEARLQVEDVNLKKQRDTCPKYCHYLSWKIQNELISNTGKLIKNVCVGDAIMIFSAWCDGTTSILAKNK